MTVSIYQVLLLIRPIIGNKRSIGANHECDCAASDWDGLDGLDDIIRAQGGAKWSTAAGSWTRAAERLGQAARAQRIIRSMGNLSGRGRLRADLTEYVPRGLMISTGEDLPPGQSILARALSVDVERDQLDFFAVTQAQRHADRLPHAMAGYIAWLAPQLDTLPATLKEQWTALRGHFAANNAAHLRVPEILAHLALDGGRVHMRRLGM